MPRGAVDLPGVRHPVRGVSSDVALSELKIYLLAKIHLKVHVISLLYILLIYFIVK